MSIRITLDYKVDSLWGGALWSFIKLRFLQLPTLLTVRLPNFAVSCEEKLSVFGIYI